ncbi:MAG: L-threonylcarbamoyladenylate synthase [Candidatus Caccovivens sp.]
MKQNKLIIFPTDTVYGIGCGIFDKENIEKIYKIKHRPKTKPLACLCANLEQIESIAIVGESERKLIEHLLPGALTIILKAKDDVKKVTGFETVGVRIPNSHIALSILSEMGPMLTTSVNESEQTPLNDYEEIVQKYGKIVDKVYNTTEKSSNLSSTVVSLLSGELKLLREGEISKDAIEEILLS